MTDTKVAYSVYYYDPPGTGYGMAGTIEDTGVDANVATTPGLKSGLNGDPLVLSFTNASSQPMLAVTDRDSASNRNVYIYDYDDTGPTITPSYTRTWANVENPNSIVRIGDYLYVMDYDSAKIMQVHATTPTPPIKDIYDEVGVVYDFNDLHSGDIGAGYTGYGQALVIYDDDGSGDELYALFSVTNGDWTDYESSWLIKLSPTGATPPALDESVANANFAGNAFTLVENGGYFYVCGIGGQQGYESPNSNSELQCLQNGFGPGTTPTTILDTSNYNYEYRDLTFNGANAYLLVGYYDTGYIMNGELIPGTLNGSSWSGGTPDTFTDVPGYYWSVLYTNDNSGRLWFAKGNQIDIYGTSVSLPVGQLGFTNLNDMCYIGADPSAMAANLRGYRSPLQASRSKLATNLRTITKGRPEATPEEFEEAKMAGELGIRSLDEENSELS